MRPGGAEVNVSVWKPVAADRHNVPSRGRSQKVDPENPSRKTRLGSPGPPAGASLRPGPMRRGGTAPRPRQPTAGGSSLVSIASMQTLRRTPLYDKHVSAGARLVPFAGWEMPVQYEGVIAEHRAVRTDAGVFDVSHMGELEVEGPRAAEFLQGVLSNDVSRLERGRRSVHAAHERERRDHRRPDRLPHRVASLPARRQRCQPRGRPCVARGPRRPRLGRSRRLRRVRAARRAGAPGARAPRPRAAAAVHVGDGRARRDRGDDRPHRLHRRGGRRARLHGRRRARALGRDPRARRPAVRSRRAGHAAARGLLPAARQRHRAAMGCDLERPRLGLRARHRVRRRRGAARRSGTRARSRSSSPSA